MKSVRILAKSSLAKLPKNIVLTGKGVTRIKVGTEFFDKSPYYELHHQDVAPSSVDAGFEDTIDVAVQKDVDGKPVLPELDMSGVYQVRLVGGLPVVQVSGGQNLWILDQVEFSRNEKV